jgi:two-component system CheB/CheR fusion protein
MMLLIDVLFLSKYGIGGMMKVVNGKNSLVTIYNDFPVVGIGTSAGGVEALKSFFRGVHDKCHDMAIVIIQHLPPDSHSYLSEIVEGITELNVIEIEDGLEVLKNNVYIIKPNHVVTIKGKRFQVSIINKENTPNNFVDIFFDSLAISYHVKSIGIILSGNGSDGAKGIQSIKKAGGLAIVQKPETAKYDSMPRSAIHTGIVDRIALGEEMFSLINEYVNHNFLTGVMNPMTCKEDTKYSSIVIDNVLTLILNKKGYNFGYYKPNTIRRRIARRLAIHKIDRIEDYYKYLLSNSREIDILVQEFLIGVTNFFRDTSAFDALKEDILLKIIGEKNVETPLRIWCSGCSTGEEAYSIAILIHELKVSLKKEFQVQIFATDLNEHAISIARKGHYSSNITKDVSPSRLKRYFKFNKLDESYVIDESVRDMIVFSVQNIIHDPPFSKLDLISCRNLLIYFNADVQLKIMNLFHYALKDEGILFLGKSESIGQSDKLFERLHNADKFFVKRAPFKNDQLNQLIELMSRFVKKETIKLKPNSQLNKVKKEDFQSLIEKTIVSESDYKGIIIDNKGNILYLHGDMNVYLRLPSGEKMSNNVFDMTQGDLKKAITLALQKIVVDSEPYEVRNVGLLIDNKCFSVDITMRQVSSITDVDDENLYIIIIKSLDLLNSDVNEVQETTNLDVTQLETLRHELEIKENYLKTINKELEARNQKLVSSNEDMQLMNEELQSTNEELETSKEELQSINEELSTVNSELQLKINDLSHANNDINNLLSGTNIATIFLDNQMNILRFNPSVSNIINIIQSDIGRPIGHFSTNLVNCDNFLEYIVSVSDTLKVINVEVLCEQGLWYEMIIQPYRTLDNVIEGIVITFVDITEVKHTKDLLEMSEANYRNLFDTSDFGIIIANGITGEINDVNIFLQNVLNMSKSEFVGKKIWEIKISENEIEHIINEKKLLSNESLHYKDLELKLPDGTFRTLDFSSSIYTIDDNRILQCKLYFNPLIES